jgi:hypothetical protein
MISRRMIGNEMEVIKMNDEKPDEQKNKFVNTLNKIEHYLAKQKFSETEKMAILKFIYETHLNLYVERFNLDRNVIENNIRDIVNAMVSKDFIRIKKVIEE